MKPKNYPFLNDDEKRRFRLERTPTERFYMLIRMIRLGQKLKQAKITEAKP